MLHVNIAQLLGHCPTACCGADAPPLPTLQLLLNSLLLLSVSLQDFREPLYLTDITTQIKDVRSAEERKYPQLFRHKLKGATALMRILWRHSMPRSLKLVLGKAPVNVHMFSTYGVTRKAPLRAAQRVAHCRLIVPGYMQTLHHQFNSSQNPAKLRDHVSMVTKCFAFVYNRMMSLYNLGFSAGMFGKCHASHIAALCCYSCMLALSTRLPVLQCMLILCKLCFAAQGWSFLDSEQTA